MKTKKEMSFDDVMHYIAQGAINITEGLTEIQAGSCIHRAMVRLCEMVKTGEISKADLEARKYGAKIRKASRTEVRNHE